MSAMDYPHNDDAEAKVIGAMFDYDDDNLPIIISLLGEFGEAIYDRRFKIWYTTAISMYREGDRVRPESIKLQLEHLGLFEKAGGDSAMDHLLFSATISVYLETYCKIITDCYFRRLLIDACKVAERKLYDVNIPMATTRRDLEAATLNAPNSKALSKPEHISSIARAEGARLNAVGRHDIGKGIKTGLANIDKIMLPLQPGNYMILAARTSVGKTTMACNIALNAAEEGVGVLIFSLEMTKGAIISKLIQIDSSVDMAQIERDSSITPFQKDKIDASIEKFQSLNIVVDDESSITPTQMRTKARAVCAKNDIGLIIVDYVGLLRVPKLEHDATATLSIVSKEVKAMAKELNAPVIALAQINRSGAEGRPELRHLKQCGSLEEDCDVAMLLYRDEVQKNSKDVIAIIAKQRTGPIGDAPLIFERNQQRFFDTDRSGCAAPVATKNYTRSHFEPEPVNHQIEYDYFEDDDTPF